MRVRVGTLEDLVERGHLLAKAGGHGVCVFWDGGRAWALDDRCPHLGFPLHRGTVEEGLVTCHWHHARFDLATGGTLDPFADDARIFPVEIEGGEVFIATGMPAHGVDVVQRRLREGLEQGLTLVTAKSVIGLLMAGTDPTEIVRVGVEFGTANRREGWGSGLTVLVAMANLLPWLDEGDKALALVHGLAFVSRDTRNHPPAFTLAPLGDATGALPPGRRASWYRRFIETRSGSAAERSLVTALAAGPGAEAEMADMMLAAATDHVFLDGGHTLDFTNKAFGGIAYGHLRSGGDPGALVAALAHCLLAEDAAFHWYQTVEAAVAQFQAWPAGSEEGALILAGTARFLAVSHPHPPRAAPRRGHRRPPASRRRPVRRGLTARPGTDQPASSLGEGSPSRSA